jgi:hypothetical protein
MSYGISACASALLQSAKKTVPLPKSVHAVVGPNAKPQIAICTAMPSNEDLKSANCGMVILPQSSALPVPPEVVRLPIKLDPGNSTGMCYELERMESRLVQADGVEKRTLILNAAPKSSAALTALIFVMRAAKLAQTQQIGVTSGNEEAGGYKPHMVPALDFNGKLNLCMVLNYACMQIALHSGVELSAKEIDCLILHLPAIAAHVGRTNKSPAGNNGSSAPEK